MRCNECLAVIEEYLDDELEQEMSRQVSGHVAACTDCAAAFDALVCEQELYTSYRRDIEVSPALWQRVSLEIERGRSAPPAPPISTFERMRERLAALVGTLRLTPALAASAALVVFAVLAASVLVFNSRRAAQTTEVASRSASETGLSAAPVESIESKPAVDAEAKTGSVDFGTKAASAKAAESDGGLRAAKALSVAEVRGRSPRIVAASSRASAKDEIIDTGHALALDEDPLLNEAVLVSVAQTPVQPAAEVEDREVARHIEKAQLLLRSFKNMSAAEGPSTADVAYEKRLSRELLNENILLRRDADNGGNVPTERLLSTLEPYLLDIANLEDKPSTDELRSITERMKKNEIIAALQVY
ncbi:MAG TPA: hypothetical protein VGB73_14355 [Pyrinomonadaceae bacterium]|jgi:anti-sigma factor RsiW